MRRLICAIVGTREGGSRWSETVRKMAYTAGTFAAKANFAVLTGGLTGVMTEAAKGAQSCGGIAIGILPGLNHCEANEFIDIVLPSGIGIARNCFIGAACDVMIALPGGTGTLEEMCFALDYERPVISWNSWRLDGKGVDFLQEEESAQVEQTLIRLREQIMGKQSP